MPGLLDGSYPIYLIHRIRLTEYVILVIAAALP